MRMAIVTGLPTVYDCASVVTLTASELLRQSTVVGVALGVCVRLALAAGLGDATAALVLAVLAVLVAGVAAGEVDVVTVGAGVPAWRCPTSALPMMASGTSTMRSANT